MIQLAIKVEAETERPFVQDLIVKQLRPIGIATQPSLVGRTSGGVTVEKLVAEMTKLVGGFDTVTSLGGTCEPSPDGQGHQVQWLNAARSHSRSDRPDTRCRGADQVWNPSGQAARGTHR